VDALGLSATADYGRLRSAKSVELSRL